MSEPRYTARCRCGKVALEMDAEPIVHMSCYCDDCQAAAALIDALDGGCSGIEADGGTPNVMFRRDHVRFVCGEDSLDEYRLRDDSPTIRLVSSCCNTAITQTHTNWFPHRSIKSHLIVEPPPLEYRVFTKYAPDRAAIPRDVRVCRGPGVRIGLRVLRAVIALRRTTR